MSTATQTPAVHIATGDIIRYEGETYTVESNTASVRDARTNQASRRIELVGQEWIILTSPAALIEVAA